MPSVHTPKKRAKRFSIHARHSPKYRDKLAFARKMRLRPTRSEKALWAILKTRPTGVRFKRQVIILGWIADFYCPAHKLVIEVDGGYHQTDQQKQSDDYRDQVMGDHGFRVVRFTEDQVLSTPDAVLREVRQVAA